jgi:lipase maturation factor 1
MELILVWMAFLPGHWKTACFFIVTMWQVVVVATANYAFLNYLVLILAILLLDDASLRRLLPLRWRGSLDEEANPTCNAKLGNPHAPDMKANPVTPMTGVDSLATIRSGLLAAVLTWIFYATVVPFAQMFWRGVPLPATPVVWLEPFRIANQYGLFAVMTPHRYEIEFQGSNDGQHWDAYPFRYKPQDVRKRPRIYAPYQPRFDWNLWFASLGSWQQNAIVPRTEELLLVNDRAVLGLFSRDPFPDAPPRLVRAVLWQYWFSSLEEKRSQKVWWRRQFLGIYAPTLTRLPDGRFAIVDDATVSSRFQP